MSWITAKSVHRLPYEIEVSWAYEEIPICEIFDDAVTDVREMERRCDAGVDTHFVVRVQAFWQGYELASDTLGSCYARDCAPEQEIQAGLGGYIEDLIDDVVAEADRELIQLNRAIRDDVRQVDNTVA